MVDTRYNTIFELRGGVDEHGEHVIEWRWLLKVPLKEQRAENLNSNQIP